MVDVGCGCYDPENSILAQQKIYGIHARPDYYDDEHKHNQEKVLDQKGRVSGMREDVDKTIGPIRKAIDKGILSKDDVEILLKKGVDGGVPDEVYKKLFPSDFTDQ